MTPRSQPLHLSSNRLSLWQALVFMLHVFPTEQTQLIWGLWGVIYGLAVALPGSHVFALSPGAYAWLPIPFPLLGVLFIAKGLPHVWGVLASVAGAFGRGEESHQARRVCLAASVLDLFVSGLLALGFLRALGLHSSFWLWYGYQSLLFFWVAWRFWLKQNKVQQNKRGG